MSSLSIPESSSSSSIYLGDKKDEREKPLLTKGKRHKVVRFLISPKKKKVKIEVNKIMNPAFLLGTAINLVKRQEHQEFGYNTYRFSAPLISLSFYSIN